MKRLVFPPLKRNHRLFFSLLCGLLVVIYKGRQLLQMDFHLAGNAESYTHKIPSAASTKKRSMKGLPTLPKHNLTKRKPPKRPRCYSGKVPVRHFEVYSETSGPDVTVVSAYFNLGRFRKGSVTYFDTNMYLTWASVYRYLKNPFIFYTDDRQVANKFKLMLSGFEGSTKIVLLERKSLWSFAWADRIRAIYSSPSYPKHHPNTVLPEYSCTQHAKYNVLEKSIKQNYFNTTYFTWIDVGYFRDIVNRKKRFVITKPPHFDESRIAMNTVYDVNMNTAVEAIFKGNHVWLGGGFCFGSKQTLPTFIEDYRQAVERYLNMSLSNTDQQVIFSMNTNRERTVVKQRVAIQQYVADVEGDCWFYLGYACYRELQ